MLRILCKAALDEDNKRVDECTDAFSLCSTSERAQAHETLFQVSHSLVCNG